MMISILIVIVMRVTNCHLKIKKNNIYTVLFCKL